MQALKLVRHFFQAIALVIFVYQMNGALWKYFSFTRISYIETKDIKDAELPSIFICPSKRGIYEGSPNKAEHGYLNIHDFAHGSVNGSRDFVSWNGISNQSYGNITRQMFKQIGWYEIEGEPKKNWETTKENAAEDFFLFEGGFCEKIVVDNNLNVSELFWTSLVLNGPRYQILIADVSRSLYYKLDTGSLMGDTIFSQRSLIKWYMIDFEEVHWMKNTGECAVYGEGEDFKTFADCVANEHEKIFNPILGCRVPWLSAPQDQRVCEGRILLSEDKLVQLQKSIELIYNKIKLSKMDRQYNACLKPCRELKAYSKLTTEDPMPYGYSSVTLSFSDKVKVIRYMESYGMFDLVVEVGSSLGLWIGLSALGVFDLVLRAGTFIQQKCSKRLYRYFSPV